MEFVVNELNSDKIKVVVENNNYGAEFFLTIKLLQQTAERGTIAALFDQHIFAEFMRDSKDDFEKGIRWNKANKKTAVRNYKSLIVNDKFDDTYPDSIDEAMNFGRLKNGTYAAQYGNDDLTMADVTMAYYIQNPSNDMFIDDLKILLSPKEIVKRKLIEEAKKNKFQYQHRGFTMRIHKKKEHKNLLFHSKNGPKSIDKKSAHKRGKRNRWMDD